MAEVSLDHSRLDVRLGKIEPAVHDALVVTVRQDAKELKAKMRSLASGDLVQVLTGKFVKSFRSRVSNRKNRVQAKVGSKSWLAHILEGGATIPAHVIQPKTAHALLVRSRSGLIFAARVQSPGGKIAPRKVVETAFDDMKDQIQSDLAEAGRAGARRI